MFWERFSLRFDEHLSHYHTESLRCWHRTRWLTWSRNLEGRLHRFSTWTVRQFSTWTVAVLLIIFKHQYVWLQGTTWHRQLSRLWCRLDVTNELNRQCSRLETRQPRQIDFWSTFHTWNQVIYMMQSRYTNIRHTQTCLLEPLTLQSCPQNSVHRGYRKHSTPAEWQRD